VRDARADPSRALTSGPPGFTAAAGCRTALGARVRTTGPEACEATSTGRERSTPGVRTPATATAATATAGRLETTRCFAGAADNPTVTAGIAADRAHLHRRRAAA